MDLATVLEKWLAADTAERECFLCKCLYAGTPDAEGYRIQHREAETRLQEASEDLLKAYEEKNKVSRMERVVRLGF